MTAQDSQNLNLNKGDRRAQLSQPARLVHRTIQTTYTYTASHPPTPTSPASPTPPR